MKTIGDIAARICAQTLEPAPLDKVPMTMRIAGESHCLLMALAYETDMPVSTLAAQLLTPAIEEFKKQFLSVTPDPVAAGERIEGRYQHYEAILRRAEESR